MKQVLVFTRTKHWADKVVKQLEKLWIIAQAIHWNKSQNARQRALTNFKSGETRVLIATDIAARWIDIDELSYVINYDLSNEPETYVHRIWRTGRAGNSWLAISFCDQEEYAYLKDIQKLIWKEIDVEENHPFVLEIDKNAKPVKKTQNSRNRNRRTMREWWKRPAVANRKRDARRKKNKRK
jgi:ATP-dependent RNA helicase RhlE